MTKKSFFQELNEIRARAGLPVMEARGQVQSYEDITPDIIQDIKNITKEVHDEEGCDVTNPNEVAHCWMVAEILENKYGWEKVCGAYLSPKKFDPVGDHCWNVLKDGTIIDSTPLQWHEGEHLKILPPNDPGQKRYRLEWSQDYNPSLHQDYPELKGIPWSGEYDMDRARRYRQERGDKWWLKESAEPYHGKSPVLYHGTNVWFMAQIIAEDSLEEGAHWGKPNEPHGPRLTEDPGIAKGFIEYSSEWAIGGLLVLDTRKLAKAYPLISYEDKPYGSDQAWAEEKEVVVETPAIKPLNKYLRDVVIDPKVIKEAMSDEGLEFAKYIWGKDPKETYAMLVGLLKYVGK